MPVTRTTFSIPLKFTYFLIKIFDNSNIQTLSSFEVLVLVIGQNNVGQNVRHLDQFRRFCPVKQPEDASFLG